MTKEAIDTMDTEAKQISQDSVKFAEESPEPPLEALYDYTFVEHDEWGAGCIAACDHSKLSRPYDQTLVKHDQFIGKWLRRCDLLGFLLAGSTVIFGYSYGVLWVGSAAVWFMVGLVGAAAKILYHRTSRRAYRTLDRIVGLGGAPILLAYQFWHQPGMGVAGILC